MADLFLYGLAGDILKRVALVLEKEIVSMVGVKSKLTEFEKTLHTVKAVLLDAEEWPDKSHELRDWLGNLNEVFSDAEDILGEFEYETLRQRMFNERGYTTKVRKFFLNSNLTFRSKMGHQVQRIKERLDTIAANKDKLNLIERDEDGRGMPMNRETNFFVPIIELIGRDDDREKFFQLLTCSSDEENVSVIPIVGMAGLGKTTIAKLLYNDERVVNHFELRIWVSVSEEFNLKRVAKEIINAAGGEDCGDFNWIKLEKLLRASLKDKLYLLILDDVWNVDHGKWLDLKNLLMDGTFGSKIIVTTRSDSDASIVCTAPEHICKLNILSDEECFSLFVNWAFRKGEEKRFPNLLKIGKDIVKKCGGIPLAVRTLGIMLFDTRDVSAWLEVKNSEIRKLQQQETDLSPALRLSYDRLPSHLKKCFAFCSIFPRNYKFNSLELIRLWIALELVKSSDENAQLEYIGRKYIKELRSLFQNVEEHGDVITFQMHDLIHDLATSVSGSDNPSGKIYRRSDRYFSIIESLPSKKVELLLPIENNVRAMIRPKGGATSKSFAKACISRFKYLRVLDLGDSQLKVLPSSIGELKLLRYLSLYNTSIRKLPNSICCLLNLQTLDLSHCSQLEELPQDIGNLINLRCLYITTMLKSLPEDGIGCLKSLLFLGIVGCCNLTSLGEGMQHLTALQTLLIGDCRSLESLPQNMKYLTALGTLFIYNCETLNLEGEEDIQGLGLGLRSSWIARLPQSKTLPQWLQGAANTLERICIGGCCELTTLPGWMQKFTSLQNVVLEDCRELSTLPVEMHSFRDLKLTIENCPKLSPRQD